MSPVKNYSKQTFFTIIIPTRERPDTLKHAIASVLAQDYDNFEVLVSDNASTDDTRKIVLSLSNPKLRYINTKKRVSMSENWEFALNNVKNGWITVIGDDDAILPNALNYADKIIQQTKTNAIRSNGCSYAWPKIRNSNFGALNLHLKAGYEIRDSKIMLQNVVNGIVSYTELPMLYNGGFISFDLVREAKKVSKTFFNYIAPDLYSAIVFSFLTKDYVYCYEPLAINGASHHSGGTMQFEKKRVERTYSPLLKFNRENTIPPHSDFPVTKNGFPVASIQAFVFEAFLQAKKFHNLKNIKISYEDQIKLILAKGGPNKKEISDWAYKFIGMHNLKHPPYWKVVSSKIQNWIIQAPKRFKVCFETFYLQGDRNVPLANVAEAAVIGGVIKSVKPSFLKRIFAHARKLKTICMQER